MKKLTLFLYSKLLYAGSCSSLVPLDVAPEESKWKWLFLCAIAFLALGVMWFISKGWWRKKPRK